MKSERKSIVIVNDNPIQLMSLCEVLRSSGFDAHPFGSASDALDGIAERPPPALIITDLQTKTIARGSA